MNDRVEDHGSDFTGGYDVETTEGLSISQKFHGSVTMKAPTRFMLPTNECRE
jgi:hypothetical protein